MCDVYFHKRNHTAIYHNLGTLFITGKSTVLCLLERFYDVSRGEIVIDGVNIRDLDPRWLHRNIAIVPQEPVLFSGSIRANISYARLARSAFADQRATAMEDDSLAVPEVTMEEVIHAGKQANAHDFIMSFPDGYETIVGERGVR